MIEAALAESQGRVSGPTGAAAKFGIPTKTLDSKIKRLGINNISSRPQAMSQSREANLLAKSARLFPVLLNRNS